MRVAAAVIDEPGARLQVEELELSDPGPGEVRVRMRACAICRSDLHVAEAGEGIRFPAVLGHEAAGIVEAAGADVGMEPGTPVVLSWSPRCGRCARCLEGRTQLCTQLSTCPPGGCFARDGAALGAYMGLGCLAEAVVVPVSRAVPVPDGIPLETLCLLGCGVTTGFGAAVHAGQVRLGSTVAVFGCGAVGLSAVQGARLAGARTIVAVDPVEARRQIACEVGATHALDPTAVDATTEIWALTAGGVDVAIEATGDVAVMARVLEAVRAGGTAVVVGLAGFAETFPVAPYHLLLEKRLTGSIYGSADPHVDFPLLADLHARGRLQLDALRGGTYTLATVNDAFAELAALRGPRPIVLCER